MKQVTRIGAGIVLLLALSHSLNVNAATLRVPEDHASIAAALAAASWGDSLDIAAGTYYEHDLIWPPGVSILGRGGSPESVVIDAQGLGRVLGGENLVSENVLSYVTLCNGRISGSPGGGLMVGGDPYLHDLIVEYCETSCYGCGIFVHGGATITDCILRYNSSSLDCCCGGGAWLQSASSDHQFSLCNVEVYGNEANSGAGLYVNNYNGHLANLDIHDNIGSGLVVAYGGDFGAIGPVIENSVFHNNSGSGIAFDGNVIIRNCTLVGNGTVGHDWAGALLCWSTWDHTYNPQISECIVAFNNGPGIRWHDPTPFTIECNNVFGNKGGNYLALPDLTGQYGNISVDPEFCDMQGEGVFGIQADSPCAAENNDCGLLMGAFPVSCEGTFTEETSWGRIKSLY